MFNQILKKKEVSRQTDQSQRLSDSSSDRQSLSTSTIQQGYRPEYSHTHDSVFRNVQILDKTWNSLRSGGEIPFPKRDGFSISNNRQKRVNHDFGVLAPAVVNSRNKSSLILAQTWEELKELFEEHKDFVRHLETHSQSPERQPTTVLDSHSSWVTRIELQQELRVAQTTLSEIKRKYAEVLGQEIDTLKQCRQSVSSDISQLNYHKQGTEQFIRNCQTIINTLCPDTFALNEEIPSKQDFVATIQQVIKDTRFSLANIPSIARSATDRGKVNNLAWLETNFSTSILPQLENLETINGKIFDQTQYVDNLDQQIRDMKQIQASDLSDVLMSHSYERNNSKDNFKIKMDTGEEITIDCTKLTSDQLKAIKEWKKSIGNYRVRKRHDNNTIVANYYESIQRRLDSVLRHKQVNPYPRKPEPQWTVGITDPPLDPNEALYEALLYMDNGHGNMYDETKQKIRKQSNTIKEWMK